MNVNEDKIKSINGCEILSDLKAGKEIIWINPDKTDFISACEDTELSMKDIDDAEDRLKRFAPFIMKCFPETKEQGGIIESVLTQIPNMKELINSKYGSDIINNRSPFISLT